MENESKKEWERLNPENNELAADIPLEVLELPTEEPAESVNAQLDADILKGREATAKLLRRENRWQIGLMILACLLCAGIIGLLVYWLGVLNYGWKL